MRNGYGGTLSGTRRDVYCILKIMKMITDEDISTFDLKFAVDRALEDQQYETRGIGPSLQRVLSHYTFRDKKFRGVHKALKKSGIINVSVTNGWDGLFFLSKPFPLKTDIGAGIRQGVLLTS